MTNSTTSLPKGCTDAMIAHLDALGATLDVSRLAPREWVGIERDLSAAFDLSDNEAHRIVWWWQQQQETRP